MKIIPTNLAGTVVVPPSKSMGHRAIISGCLAGQATIENLSPSVDITATVGAMQALGARLQFDGSRLAVTGFSPVSDPVLDCCESGSTLRFLIPVAAALCDHVTFTGAKRLFERPLSIYFDIFDRQGIRYQLSAGRLELWGRLQSGRFAMPGDVSSQFISGLLFAAPLLEGDTLLELTTPLESAPYVDLTTEALHRAGISCESRGYQAFAVKGGQAYRPFSYVNEGDYSQAAFFLAMGALGGDVRCAGLSLHSAQGDRAFVSILEQMGAECRHHADGSVQMLPSALHGTAVDVQNIPDLVPPLAVVCAMAEGESRLYNAGRLRIKESDRLDAVTKELSALGADITEGPDYLLIRGVKRFCGGATDSHNDHRIAMSIAVASQACDGEITLTGSGAVAKSLPDFWEIMKRLGGQIYEQ